MRKERLHSALSNERLSTTEVATRLFVSLVTVLSLEKCYVSFKPTYIRLDLQSRCFLLGMKVAPTLGKQ
jgi:hypothetical protein